MRQNQVSIRFLSILWLGYLSTAVTGCSIDVFPVHYSWVNSAQNANKPIARGPSAPGAFKKSWTFESLGGYQYDPSKVEIANGTARLKPLKTHTGDSHFPTARDKAVVEISKGASYIALDSFSEVPGPNHQGEIRYQLSQDGSQWHYYNGKEWTPAAPHSLNANTASEINSAITNFHSEVGPGTLYIKFFLISPKGTEPAELQKIVVDGIAPKTDGWN